jgi:hypothetical protein
MSAVSAKREKTYLEMTRFFFIADYCFMISWNRYA